MLIDRRLIATSSACLVLDFVLGELTAPRCADCFRAHGWPLRYRYEGGFVGGGGWAWDCLWRDVFWSLVVAIILWAIWQALLSRKTRLAEAVMRRGTWGFIRVFLGVGFSLGLISALRQQMRGTIAPAFAPANSAEAFGFNLSHVLVGVLILWLFWSGIRMIEKARPATPDHGRKDDLAA